MYSDEEIKKHVEQELKWDAEIDATDLAVSVNRKVVALTGYVHKYEDKLIAERDAKRVIGVHGVANDIEVRLGSDARVDAEIVRDVVAAMENLLPFAHQTIKVVADKGHLTLEGRVEWEFQRRRAEIAARHVRGIRSVVNRIALAPVATPRDVKSQIQSALMRSANVEAARIAVQANGGEVVLSGEVRSLSESAEIERAAWKAPGVVGVVNRLMLADR